jgi:SnoaL-like domain
MTTGAEISGQLRQLTDRMEIHDCMQRYARGIDRQDRALLRSAYHDDAVDDHVGFVVNGDEAHAETYYLFVGTDRDPANHMTISGGRYVDRLERREGRWAIVDRVCVVEWNADSTSLITEEVIAMLADADIKGAAHGRHDPSYERPLIATRARTDC